MKCPYVFTRPSFLTDEPAPGSWPDVSRFQSPDPRILCSSEASTKRLWSSDIVKHFQSGSWSVASITLRRHDNRASQSASSSEFWVIFRGWEGGGSNLSEWIPRMPHQGRTSLRGEGPDGSNMTAAGVTHGDGRRAFRLLGRWSRHTRTPWCCPKLCCCSG